MENGSLHALRNVAGIGRGSGELRRRGEAHLIIDDEMNASARIITANSRKTEAFPDDALTRESSIAVDKDREHFLVLRQIVANHLLRPRSEERRVGKEWVGTCSTGWSPDH